MLTSASVFSSDQQIVGGPSKRWMNAAETRARREVNRRSLDLRLFRGSVSLIRVLRSTSAALAVDRYLDLLLDVHRRHRST
jgi:hypothetical protein